MLSKEKFRSGISKLSDVYPNWAVKMDQPSVMASWYSFFENDSDLVFLETVDEHIREERYSPTIASLLESREIAIKRIKDGERKLAPKDFKKVFLPLRDEQDG
jgi:hypothetical protein